MDLGTEAALLGTVWDRISSGKQEEIRDLLFHPHDLLPKDLHHYAYDGSLTTPPCTEGVHWIVLKEPIFITASHLERCVSLIGYMPDRSNRSTNGDRGRVNAVFSMWSSDIACQRMARSLSG